MSANTETIAQIQGKVADELLPALKAAESVSLDIAGESVEIPQQVKARLKQKVNSVVVECRNLLNHIQV